MHKEFAAWRPDAVAVLDNKKARQSMSRYFSVMQNEKLAKFAIAKKLAADFNPNSTLEQLWTLHRELTRRFYDLEKQSDEAKSQDEANYPERSFLDLKAEISRRIMEKCHLCTRRCGFNRMAGEAGLWCKAGNQITVSSMFEHMGEEPELVPSGTIFTMGCTMRCKHCQNWTISQWEETGEVYTPRRLAHSVENLRQKGCRNINLVGGEPTPWLGQWLETFKNVGVNVPIVWNSNSYYSEETAKLLAGFADLYLLDFKYGNNECAVRISDAPDYWETCTRNHYYARRYGELLIRVLVLPGHLECCVKPILNWISKNLGDWIRVNVMFQYRPEWKAHEIPELRRKLTKDEMERAIEIAKEAGLANFLT